MPNGTTTTLSQLADAITPWAVRVVATLRVADRLAQGPASVDELAKWSDVNVDALRRVLRYLAVRGMFAEPQPDFFELTDVARPLVEGHPSGMRMFLDIEGMGVRMDRVFSELLHTVRTGQPAYEIVHGAPFWADVAAHPEISPSFDELMAMHDFWLDELLDAYDWPAAGSVLDVGGGNGRLLAKLLRRYPSVSGTLLDVPQIMAAAEQHLVGAGVRDRCQLVAGSFFDALPAGSHVSVLANVLHDWGDADVVRVLRRCADAVGPEGSVLIADRLIGGDEDDRLVTMLDLRMLTTVGGRERDLAGYTSLAAEAGLALVSDSSLSRGFALLAFRAGSELGA